MSKSSELPRVVAMTDHVQKTLARLELMFLLSLLNRVHMLERVLYPSDSFALRASI